ncbi:MAG: DEAD/DEAH box helicase family protein, partial [Blastocatellia bacterium]
MESGVALVEDRIRALLDRGGSLRFLTGDYLGATDPDALEWLLSLTGNRDLKGFEAAGTSFHPKAYIVHGADGTGTAFVGSSNLTRIALTSGVEWNYGLAATTDPDGYRDVADAFETLFAHERAKPLTQAWIDDYRRRRPRLVQYPRSAEAAAVGHEPPEPPHDPHEVQREALLALEQSREDGNEAGLVVLATGLGKTWLSAFDSSRPEYRRVLFVAHRAEILAQARESFRRMRPGASFGFYSGQERTSEAEVLFASIQTIGRRNHLDQFARDAFDYIVVDEFHHAAAPSYRRLIDHFLPKFLLGLTATPERTDGGDLLALCDENLVYKCDLCEGISRGLLSPYHYFGVPDVVDYAQIPWRSTRFDEEALTTAVATEARAQNALEQWRERAGTRTLAFCVSQRHADFMKKHFQSAGMPVAAVHSGPTSDPRGKSVQDLKAGLIRILFAVDMFNEGLDVPEIDTVLMLRPTESRIIWLQQFGRGLRRAADKPYLTVIDYIGNHRSFLVKPRALLGLGPGHAEVRDALARLETNNYELPPGCEVTYELEAVDILR